MTVLEMHIELDLFVQQMNSSAYRKISPEEKDRMLNEATYEFIDSVFDDRVDFKQIGFEGNSRRLVDVKDLLVTGVRVPLYKLSDEDATYGFLPPDFFYPGSLRVKTGLLPEVKIAVVYVGRVDFVEDRENLYKGFRITHNGEEIFNLGNHPAYAEGLNEYEERFVLIDMILDAVNKTNVKAYWERFDNELSPYQFTFISGNQNEILQFYFNDIETTAIFEERSEQVYQGTAFAYRSRLTGTEDLQDVLNHSLSKTKFSSPVSSIDGDRVVVHQKDFASTEAILNYIRKPKKISLALGQNCEIRSESAQYRIIRLAGKKILRNLEAGSYQSAAQENIISQ